MRVSFLLAALALAGCQCDSSVIYVDDAGFDAGQPPGDGDAPQDSGTRFDAGTLDCTPPDVLIALDRTLTMHRTAAGDTPADTAAGHASAKWTQAIEGIETLVAPPLDTTVRFGLELWPKVEPQCVTLGERIRGVMATNASCEGPEVLVEPDLGTGAQIAATLDPETTPLCLSTPTGVALLGARQFLEAHHDAGTAQFVVLVTDGADWDVSCPTPDPRDVVEGLSDAGISTVVVGFSAEMAVQNGVGTGFLNDLTCAGGTAKDPARQCAATADGHTRAVPDAGVLFYVATDAQQLVESLRDFTRDVCCGCIN